MEPIVEISEDLILSAREAGERTGRSVVEQIEYWVTLGRVVERSLGSDRALALVKHAEMTQNSTRPSTTDTSPDIMI